MYLDLHWGLELLNSCSVSQRHKRHRDRVISQRLMNILYKTGVCCCMLGYCVALIWYHLKYSALQSVVV